MIPSVKWYMGQSLLPNHFEALQDSSRLQNFQIINSSGIPYYGIYKINIEKMFLKMGVIRVTELQVITVDGQFIELGTNSEYKDIDLTGFSDNKIELYLNFYDKEVDYEFKNKMIKGNGYLIRSLDRADPSAKYFLKLAEIEKDLNNSWSISANYIPSTINLNTSLCLELLSRVLEMTKKIIFNYEHMLKDSDFVLKAVEFRPTLYHAYNIKFSIDNIMSGNNIHPYHLYKLLYNLYVRAGVFFNIVPEEIKPYAHNDILSIFNELLLKIDELIAPKNQTSNFIRFTLNNKYYEVNDLSDKLLFARELFLVIQKRNNEQPFDISELKLSSPGRYSTIDKLALTGIKKTLLKKVPFRHYLSENCLFYKLSLGKEWDYVVKERSITFADNEKYKDMKFYLCYF